MMNIKLLAVVTTPSVYHGFSTWKTFWEENFTLGEFSDLNIENCGRRNVRKYREIKGIDKYVTLEISLKFDSLDKMRIKYSGSKVKLGRPGKGFITYLSLGAKKGQINLKRQGMKSEMSVRRTFQRFLGSLKIPYESYEKNRPKHEPNDSYFYI